MKGVLHGAAGGATGFLFPYAVAMADFVPGLNHGTNYETVLGYMVAGALLGAALAVFIGKRRR